MHFETFFALILVEGYGNLGDSVKERSTYKILIGWLSQSPTNVIWLSTHILRVLNRKREV